MASIRALILMFPTVLVACATAVSQDLIDDDDGHSTGAVSTSGKGGVTSKAGNSTGGKASGGTGTQAFGGTATKGGDTSEGGEESGGGGGGVTAGSGGEAGGGSAGKASGGSAGSSSGGGGAGGGGGSGGTPVGSGDCADTPLFQVGPATKYAKMDKVVSTCTVGTPCTLANPPGVSGKQYEFSCLDEYNCGTQDPGSTNWSQPPWQMTKACE
jgi:hypothetical protein